MLREKIRRDLSVAISKLKTPNAKIEVELTRTGDVKFGDYTTNVALKMAKAHPGGESGSKQSPVEFARVLTGSLKDQPYVEKLEVAGPGFINFLIKKEVWLEEIQKLLGSADRHSGDPAKAGDSRIKKSGFWTLQCSGQASQNDSEVVKKIVVEFTDPNPFKEFHIGHLYSNIVGESICRLLEAVGNQVKRANYQGDIGMHVAKTIWAIPRLLKQENETFEQQEKKDLSARVFFLGQAYSLGAKEFEASEEVKKEVAELNKKIFAKDPSVAEFYEKGRKWSLDYFEEIYKRLGTKFDFYYFESEVGEVGAKIVREFLKKGVFVESEGAIIFPGEKEGLHNRVFINSLGLPTYEAKELGLAPTKYEQFPYDLSIIVTGNEINEYFKVLLAALAKIRPELAQKTKHIGHGMVRMPGGKMSSRLGNVLLGEWLLDESKKRVSSAFSGVSAALSEQIGTGAVKYALLKGSIGQDVAFSFEESISLSGNSGPYLQYTYARCKSVLAKVPTPVILGIRQKPETPESKKADSGPFNVQGKQARMTNVNTMSSEEDLLQRSLGHFEEVVIDAASAFAPNIVANFLYEIAQKYNTLYNNLPILKASEDERSRRLFLTEATAEILKKGLYLLGISAPEKM